MWDWLDNLANDISGQVATIYAAITWLFTVLVKVANFLWAVDLAIAEFAETTKAHIVDFFHSLYTLFLAALIAKLIAAVRALHKWLETKLKPIIDFLVALRKLINHYFNTYVKPFLNMLQHVRQYLGILRLLGVKWAGALDNRLGQIEGAIAGIFLQMRAILNAGIDILNCLADPLNLFRRPTAVLSIRRILPSLVRVSTGYPIGFFLPSPRAGSPLGVGQLPLNFNPQDPAMNPPASSYFSGDDGLGAFSGFTDGEVPDDGAVDDLTALEFFDDSLYASPVCTDLDSCIQLTVQTGATATLFGQVP